MDAELILSILIAIAILSYIIYAVLTNNKGLASLSQLGDLQKRADVNDEIQHVRRASIDSKEAGIEKVTPISKVGIEFSKGVSVSERVSFVIGVLNLSVTLYILGAFPTQFYLWYTPKAIGLIFARWLDFMTKQTHWLLADFCYWANLLVLLYIWVFPKSELLFQIVFLCANGPLAWSVLTFNQALVFHKWQQIVSVFIHVSPMLLSYGIRWYPSSFGVCKDFPGCESVKYFDLVFNALVYFYLWWVALYYLIIFVMLGPYLESRSFKTLFDRVAGTQMKFLFGEKGAFGSSHKLIQKGVYMLTHVLFSIFTMVVSLMWWSYWYLHLSFILVICTASAYNASLHYEAQFKTDREGSKKK